MANNEKESAIEEDEKSETKEQEGGKNTWIKEGSGREGDTHFFDILLSFWVTY